MNSKPTVTITFTAEEDELLALYELLKKCDWNTMRSQFACDGDADKANRALTAFKLKMRDAVSSL